MLFTSWCVALELYIRHSYSISYHFTLNLMLIYRSLFFFCTFLLPILYLIYLLFYSSCNGVDNRHTKSIPPWIIKVFLITNASLNIFNLTTAEETVEDPKTKWLPKIFRAKLHHCGNIMRVAMFSLLENKFKI